MILTVENLSYSYDDVTVIDDINLTISEGKYVSIVGHNGCGKTTLSKLLIGLYQPKNGRVLLNGKDINERSNSKLKNKMSLVFQNPDNQFIGATVEDDIAFGLENRSFDPLLMKDTIIKFADAVGMKDFLTKEPSLLSGGQKQRVAIAGALALNPEILILDEATSMLDPKGKKEILALIQTLKKQRPNLTVISITHDIEEAYLSDEIVVLAHGKVIYQGKPHDMLNQKEQLKSIGLGMPFYFTIKDALNDAGFDLTNCSNLDDIEEYLCQLK